MNHIYFTALISSAGLAAALAKGDGSGTGLYCRDQLGISKMTQMLRTKNFQET